MRGGGNTDDMGGRRWRRIRGTRTGEHLVPSDWGSFNTRDNSWDLQFRPSVRHGEPGRGKKVSIKVPLVGFLGGPIK